MKSIYKLNQLFGLLLASCLVAAVPASLRAQECMELIWSDEFDGTDLDTERWSYDIGDGCPNLCGWGNQEQQFYTDSPENITVEDGLLVITAREEIPGEESYSSARIHSRGKADFLHGRFEARMRLPLTQGMWPAFWMLPTDQVYGGWPQSGELDIMELRGSNPGQVLGTVHTGLPHTYISGYYDLPLGETFADDFHIFSMEWEPDSITFFVDGIQFHQLTPDDISPWEPFLEEFHFVLNLAVGGLFGGMVDSTTEFPQTMEVDYVRVYNRPDRLSIRGDQPIAEAAGIEYSTYDIEGATYIWTVPDDAMITSGQGTNQITVDWGCTVGNVELQLQTDCDDAFLSYDVEGFLEPTISGETTVDLNQAGINYSIPQGSAGNLTWEVPEGSVIVSGQGTNEIVVDWGCEPGEVMVSLNGSCGDAFSLALPVALQTYAVLGQPSVPANTPNRTYSIGELPGATYTWSVPSDASIVSGQGTNTIQVDFGMADGVISAMVETSCGTGGYERSVAIEDSYLYADFDNIDLDFIAYDDAVFEEVANPNPSGINTSALVGKVNKTFESTFFAGIEADVYEVAFDLRPIMTEKVYSGTPGLVRFMLDDETTGEERLKLELEYGPDDVNQWVQLVYDFTEAPSEVYDQLRLTYNHGSTTTEFWYFDDVMGHRASFLSDTEEEELTEAISVYPNPSSGLYFMDAKGVFAPGTLYALEVVDMLGRSILRKQVVAQGQQVMFDLSDQPAGLYAVCLRGQSLRYAKVIVKE